SPFPLSRSRGRTQESDSRQLSRLLRACRERPHRCAAEQRHECASPHSITSSAREHFSLTCALSDHVLGGRQAAPNNCPAIVLRPNGPTGPSGSFFLRQGCSPD